MLNEFKNGVKYIEDQNKFYTTLHFDLMERWKESRFAFIAFVNVPFIFSSYFEPFDNLVTLVCWLSIIVLSIMLLSIRSKRDGIHVTFSEKALEFYKDAAFDIALIDEKDHTQQKQWLKDYINPFQKRKMYEELTDSVNIEKYLELTDNIIAKISRLIIIIFLIALLNVLLEAIFSYQEVLSNWMLYKYGHWWFAKLQNFSEFLIFYMISLPVFLIWEVLNLGMTGQIHEEMKQNPLIKKWMHLFFVFKKKM